jgi:hypothetical protein
MVPRDSALFRVTPQLNFVGYPGGIFEMDRYYKHLRAGFQSRPQERTLAPRGEVGPQGWSCHLGVKSSVRPSILLNTPRGVRRGEQSPYLGNKVHPLGAKFIPWGKLMLCLPFDSVGSTQSDNLVAGLGVQSNQADPILIWFTVHDIRSYSTKICTTQQWSFVDSQQKRPSVAYFYNSTWCIAFMYNYICIQR